MIDLQADREQSYEAVRRAPSDIQDHLETLVDLVVRENAQVVIELGVRFGYSTVALLYALGQTGGHLWSIDVDRRFVVDDPARTFTQGHDLDLNVLVQMPKDVDVVIFDTDYTYELTCAEIRTYGNLLRRGGRLIFHGTGVDAFDDHPPGSQPSYPVMRAVDELLPIDTHPRTHLTNGRGLTIVTVP